MALNKQALQQGIIRLQQDMQRKTDASMEGICGTLSKPY